MKLSDKLDVLQKMAKEHDGKAHALYLVGLLVEHAEEEECTEKMLAWAREVLATMR